MLLKRFFLPIISLFLLVLLAACGSTTSSSGGPYSSGSAGGSTPTTASTPTIAPSTPTSTGSGSSAVAVKTATAQVKGKAQTILTNSDGKTLYYFTPDSATTAACTGSCISAWPPLLFSGSGSPTSASTLSGKLTAVADGNGMQVEYNGHPLYLYAGDTAAGQTTGEGLFGKWFVATPDIPLQSGGASNGYGYGN